MYHSALEVSQGLGDVSEHPDGFFQGQRSALPHVRAERLLGAGHDEHPLVFVFAAVDDRDDVAHTLQIGEQHLSISTGLLCHQLHRSRRIAGGLCLVNGSEAALPHGLAKDPALL